MSFENLDKEELLKAVDFFGVEVHDPKDEEAMREALEKDGVTEAQYKQFLVPDEDEEVVEEKPKAKRGRKPTVKAEAPVQPKRHLVRMTRNNPIFQIGKYKWTRSHPFQLVDERDVDRVVRGHEGFSLATPNEAEEFYK